MIRSLRLGCATILVARLCGVPAAEARQSTADEAVRAVRAVAERIVRADNASDLMGVLACYANDAMLMPPNEPPVAGKAAIRPRYEGLFRDYRPAIEGHIDEVIVAGRLAYVRGRNGGQLMGRDGKPNRTLDDVYLMILTNQENQWRIARLIWHPARPAGPAVEVDAAPTLRAMIYSYDRLA